MFVIYFYIQFLITISNSLSYITIKPKAKHGFPLSITVFFHILWGQQGINPYPTAFPYGNGMVLHFYQQQESSTTKTVHKVINKGLKAYV